MKIDLRNIKLGETYYVCAATMNHAFDRFVRIQKPTLVEYKYDDLHRHRKLYPAKGRPFNATFDVKFFDNYTECVEHFNDLIDRGSQQHKVKLEQMEIKLKEMLSKKITVEK